eukprot:Stramenopile-MAST_4_protein_4854
MHTDAFNELIENLKENNPTWNRHRGEVEVRVKEGHEDVHFPPMLERAGAPLESKGKAKKKIVTTKASNAPGKRGAPSKSEAKAEEKSVTKNPSRVHDVAKNLGAYCVSLSCTRLKLQVVVRKTDRNKSDRYWYDFELQKKLRSFVEIERWLKTAYPDDCKLHGIWLATLKEECARGSEKVIEATRLHLAAVNVSQAKSSTRPAKAFEKAATVNTSAKRPMKASDKIEAKKRSSASTASNIVMQETVQGQRTNTKKRKALGSDDEVSMWFLEHDLAEFEEDFRSIGFKKIRHLKHIQSDSIDWCTLINKRRIALGKEELDDFEKADLAEAFAMSDPSAARAASNPVPSPIVVATSERILETPEMVAAHMVRNGIDKAADIKDRLKKQFGLTSVKALMIANKAIKSPGDEPAPMEATTLEVPPENAPVRPLETPGMVAAVRAASPPPIMNLLECPICCGEHPPEDMITVDVCEHQVCKLCLKRYLLDPMTGLFRDKANFGKVDFVEGADFKVGFHPATKALTVSCPHHECSRPMCCSLLFFRDLFSKPPFLSTAREECMVLDTAMCWAIETSLNLVSCPLGQYEVSTEGSLVNRDLLARVCPSLMEFYEDGTLENNIDLLPQEYWDATTQLSGTRDCRSVFEVFDIAPLNRITCPRDCKGCGRDFCLVCNEAWASCKCLRFNLEVDVTSKEAVLAVALPPTSKIPLRAEAASCAIEGCPVEPDSDESGFVECGSCGARCCSSCTQFEVWNKTPNLSPEDLIKIKEKGSDGATYNPSKSKICVDCYEYYLHHSWQRLCSNENAIRGFEKRTGLRR